MKVARYGLDMLLGHFLQGTALTLALTACAAPPPPAAGPEAGRQDTAKPERGRIFRPGQVLYFKGRSTSSLSRPDLEPLPRVGWALSSLSVLEQDPDGRLTLGEETFLYSADGESPGRLGDPQDRRTRRLVIDPAAGKTSAGPAFSSPASGASERFPEVELSITDDGFGLNAAARTEVGLATLLLAPDTFRRLAAGETVSRTFDFWLVRDDPRADRTVVSRSISSKPPTGAEGRVWGSTELRPLGPEQHVVDWRAARPGSDQDPGTEPVVQPDLRIELPARGIGVAVKLTIERPIGAGSAPPSTIRRRDSLTWIVLDDPDAPWLLAWDGTVEWQRGEGGLAERREAYLSHRLFRVEETGSGAELAPRSP